MLIKKQEKIANFPPDVEKKLVEARRQLVSDLFLEMKSKITGYIFNFEQDLKLWPAFLFDYELTEEEIKIQLVLFLEEFSQELKKRVMAVNK